MVESIEAQTALRFKALARYPDYHPEFPGGKPGGRSLDPGLFDSNELGAWKKKPPAQPRLRHDRDVGGRGDRLGRLLQAAEAPVQAPRRALRQGPRLLRRRARGAAPQGAPRSRRSSRCLEHAARELVVEEGRVDRRARRAPGAGGLRSRAAGRRPRVRRLRVEPRARGAVPRRASSPTPTARRATRGTASRWPWPSAPISGT